MGKDEAAADAVRRIRRGEIVLVVDGEDRENEGDLTVAAQWASAAAVNFMLRWGRGLVCLPCDGEILDRLAIGPMVEVSSALSGDVRRFVGASDEINLRRAATVQDTAFTVSIDHSSTGSGISAADRARTVRHAARADAAPEEFSRPGHVFPLRARTGGVLDRPGHTEAAVDLARLAGLRPAAAICEVLDDDGEPARRGTLERFAEAHAIAIVTIEAIIEHRRGVGENTRPIPVML